MQFLQGIGGKLARKLTGMLSRMVWPVQRKSLSRLIWRSLLLLLPLLLCIPLRTQAANRSYIPVEDQMFVVGPDVRFGISLFALRFEQDLSVLLNTPPINPISLAQLDAHGYFPDFDVPIDSTDSQRLAQKTKRSADPLDKDKDKELLPPKPPVSIGLPSAAAATGALLGGAALMIHALAKLF